MKINPYVKVGLIGAVAGGTLEAGSEYIIKKNTKGFKDTFGDVMDSQDMKQIDSLSKEKKLLNASSIGYASLFGMTLAMGARAIVKAVSRK